MSSRRISDFTGDESGNIIGGPSYEWRVYLAGTATLASIFGEAGLVTALANPLFPNAGFQGSFANTRVAGDTTANLQTGQGANFHVGDSVLITDGVNAIYRTIILIGGAGDTLTFDSAFGFGFAATSTLCGHVMSTGHVQAWVSDAFDYETTLKNIASGIEGPRKGWPMQAASLVGANHIANSDMAKKTVWGLMMPEVFANNDGFQQIDGGAGPTVLANALTFGAANNHLGYPRLPSAGAGWFRDCRLSVQFKAVSATGVFTARLHYVDANNFIEVMADGTNFMLRKTVAGTLTTVATVAQALVLNNRYWLELEAQGTTYIAKLYNSGAASALKSAATLLQTHVATIADAAVVVGGVTFTSNQATCVIGEQAASPGGFYVEGWLPESLAITYGGTLGGQIVTLDEAADTGPLAKQRTLRIAIPRATRTITLTQDTPDGSIPPSLTHTFSSYQKVADLGGSGVLVRQTFQRSNSANASQGTSNLDDAGETTWTRKTVSVVTEAGTRRARMTLSINPSSTALGTAFIMLPQLEQSAAATPWRNAFSDDVLNVELTNTSGGKATTSVTYVDFDSRDSAIDLDLPWDADVEVKAAGAFSHGTTGASVLWTLTADGTVWESGASGLFAVQEPTLNYACGLALEGRKRLAAGKHRIALQWKVSAGTATGFADAAAGLPMVLSVTASRGK